MESFKVSKLSVCHDCSNINEACSNKVWMMCGTDSKIKTAYVMRCGHFNSDISNITIHKPHTIQADARPDSRVEMMGGGHDLNEK